MPAKKRFAGILMLLVICLAVPTSYGFAQGKTPVPPPDPTTVSAILAQQGQITFTAVSASLKAPDFVAANLATLASSIGSSATFDTTRAVNYSEHDAKGVVLVAIPLVDTSAGLTPDPNLKLNGQQGTVVGGLYVPGVGTILMVAISGKNGKDYSGKFYVNASGTVKEYTPKSVDITRRTLKNKPPADSKGISIDKHSVCYILGTDQLCVDIESFVPKAFTKSFDLAKGPMDTLKKTFNVSIEFDEDSIVADLEGVEQRQQCATALGKSKEDKQLAPECAPTMLMGASKKQGPGQPLAFLVFFADIKQQVFNQSGGFEIQTIKSGAYLVFDATPTLTEVGQVGAFQLVGIAGVQYLTPYEVVQTFVPSTDPKAKPAAQVSISDANVAGKEFFR